VIFLSSELCDVRWPLRYQILFPFGGVMLAVVLGVSLLDAVLAARRTQRQIERQLNEVAQTLLDATFPLTDAVLRQTRGLSGAEFLLTDQQGNLRAASLTPIDISQISREPNAGREFRLGDPITLAAGEFFHTAITLRERGTQTEPLLLHILYPQSYLREARWQAAYPPLLVGTALLGVVIVLAVGIAGRLSRPILDLRRELGRLVKGEFRPLPAPRRNDEMSDLIGSVNSLGEELDELRRAIKRSERLALLGQLSGGLAHQLRNSVTGARIAVQLHQRRCREIDPDSLAVALRQLSLTESHLERFLTAGQPSAPRRERCDLRRIMLDVVGLVGPSCDHRGVDLQSETMGNASGEVWADADQLRQLLLNLVLNGIEAAGKNGWVRVELTAREQATILRVLDSGSGPPAPILERLFEPFATGKPEGIGLGLVVAQKIAEAHGGTIRYLDSRPTCFEVVLPKSVIDDHESAPELTVGASTPMPVLEP
jgi:signal transduction histidine kinase